MMPRFLNHQKIKVRCDDETLRFERERDEWQQKIDETAKKVKPLRRTKR